LYATNKECDEYNTRALNDLGEPVVKLPVKHSQPMLISLGARVILLRNFWTQAGLTSGITGTVTGLLYNKYARVNVHLPTVIFVKFDRELSIKCVEQGSIPIPRVRERTFIPELKRYCTVSTFPLLLSFGITIARSQTATLPKACIKFGPEFSLQLSYVALSRVEKLENLIILNDKLELERFNNEKFFRGFDKLKCNLIRLGLEYKECADEFDSEGNELMFKIDM
jgi:hypothetical protein